MGMDDIDWDELAKDNEPEVVAAFKEMIENVTEAESLPMAFTRLTNVELKLMAQFIENANYPGVAFLCSVLVEGFQALGQVAWGIARRDDDTKTIAELESAVNTVSEVAQTFLQRQGLPVVNQDIVSFLEEKSP